MSKKVLYGVFLAIAMLAMIPLTANQVTAQGASPAVFADTITENGILKYKISELTYAAGQTACAVGYSANGYWDGYNLTTDNLIEIEYRHIHLKHAKIIDMRDIRHQRNCHRIRSRSKINLL